MATSQHTPFRVAPTNSDLSLNTGQCVIFSSGFLALAGANARVILGVLVDDPISGQSGTYQVYDKARVKAGAAVAQYANLATDSTGRLVTATSGQFIVAIALTAAGGANEFFEAELRFCGTAP
jgi:hypothetical protein